METEARPDGLNIPTRIERFDISKLNLLEVNARFMRHETFARLVENIRRDGGLTSVPFAVLEADGAYRVVSGNHRVMAAREAGLQEIDVMVTDEPLNPDRIRALQLAHNAITGEDDPVLLGQIYTAIEDLDWRLYTGLDDKMLDLLGDVDADSLNDPSLMFQTVTFAFLPSDIDDLLKVFDRVARDVKGLSFLNRWAEYDRFLDAMEETAEAHHIRNSATVLSIILDIFEAHRPDLAQGWDDVEGVRHQGWVPLSSVLGNSKVPAPMAKKLKRIIDRMVSREEAADPLAAFDLALDRLNTTESEQ